MKLLFDENLAPRFVITLTDIYPGSGHVRDCGLQSSPDRCVWDYAIDHDYVIVSKDSDFRQRSFLYGLPPKVIWTRLGNCSTRQISELLRVRQNEIETFGMNRVQSFLGLG